MTDGVMIKYISRSGYNDVTWMGRPFSNVSLSSDDVHMLYLSMMKRSHPGSKVISIIPCTLENFRKLYD